MTLQTIGRDADVSAPQHARARAIKARRVQKFNLKAIIID
jgi:hypothetical protein